MILITGTPAMNRPRELFNLLAIIRPLVFRDFKDFGMRYCDPQPRRYGPPGLDYNGSSNLIELKYIMQSGIMLRRMKSEVIRDLPPKIRSVIDIPTEEKLRKKIQACLNGAL